MQFALNSSRPLAASPLAASIAVMRAFPSDRIGRRVPFRNRKTPKKIKEISAFWRFAKWLIYLCIAFVAVSLILVVPIRWVNPMTSAFMLADDSGRVPVKFEWTAWPNIGDAPPIAVVASEDQKFASHFGFDVTSIRSSVEAYNDGAPLRGASTITQQVAKNLYLWPGKSFIRKGVEAWLTLLIEATWPKKRILEVYLNIAELGPGLYGVTAASGAYFNKQPAELSDAEAALFAAVLPNPNQLHVDQPSDYVRERQAWILSQMRRLRREQWSTLID